MAHVWQGVINEYKDRLPVTETTEVITMGEGGTPLIRARALSELTDASAAPPLLRERAERGDLGAKSGRGFAEHDAEAPARFARRLAALLAARDGLPGA